MLIINSDVNLPEFNDLDILKFVVSAKRPVRFGDIKRQMYEIVKKSHYSSRAKPLLNKIGVQLTRKLDRLTEDGVIKKDPETHKKVWYSSTPKTKSEIFRLTLNHSKFYKFGYDGFWTFEGKPTFFFEPQDPEVVTKILEIMKKNDKETKQFVKFLTSLMRFVVQGLVFSKEGKYTNSADFYKENVYFIGKFSKETSLLMKKVVEQGISDYTTIFRDGISRMEDFWKDFGQGKGIITIPSGTLFKYDVNKQKIVEINSKKTNLKTFEKSGRFSSGTFGQILVPNSENLSGKKV